MNEEHIQSDACPWRRGVHLCDCLVALEPLDAPAPASDARQHAQSAPVLHGHGGPCPCGRPRSGGHRA